MRKKIILLFICLLITSCGYFEEKEPAIIIDNIKIGADEFQKQYQSFVVNVDDSLAKEEFLETFVARKLILREAEKMGLDKDPQFLSSIQDFWEQTLLKLILSRKIRDLSRDIKITEEEIKEYYNQHKDNELEGKELKEVYSQIRWVLLAEKQKETIAQWSASLRNGVKVEIDYEKLGIKKNQKVTEDEEE